MTLVIPVKRVSCNLCGILPFETQETDSLADSDLSSSFFFQALIKKQLRHRLYHPQLAQHNLRDSLVSVIKSLGESLKIQPVTLCTGVALFDSVISRYTLEEERIKVIAVMCLQLACKLFEKNENVMSFEELESFLQRRFSKPELIQCEQQLLQLFEYNMNVVTPLQFLNLVKLPFWRGACSLCGNETTPRDLKSLVQILLVQASLEYRANQLTPVAVVRAAVSRAKYLLGFASREREELILFHGQEKAFSDSESMEKFEYQLFNGRDSSVAKFSQPENWQKKLRNSRKTVDEELQSCPVSPFHEIRK